MLGLQKQVASNLINKTEIPREKRSDIILYLIIIIFGLVKTLDLQSVDFPSNKVNI